MIIIGLPVILVFKRKIENKEITAIHHIIWWVTGTMVWGVASIILVVWWFNQIQ